MADSLTQLVDAELEAGPYTSDSHYIQTARNVEKQIECLKKLHEREKQPKASSAGMGTKQKTISFNT